MAAFEDYAQYILPQYSNLPRGRYVSLFIVRKTESEAIFRTEGSGEGLVKELVTAGRSIVTPIRRVVISKRKQTAVERRTGRDLLREHSLLKKPQGKNADKYEICMLNTNTPCEQCIDCWLYGFAAGGGGAQKSRVLTDDAFSLGPVAQISARRTFNATFDNGTMRNPLTHEPSTSINSEEYVLPQTHFLDIETLKDVTLIELQYVIGNIMRSNRYGAISSRVGRVDNRIVAVAFSDCELFSNLELTQTVYDLLFEQALTAANEQAAKEQLPAPNPDEIDLPFPLADAAIDAAVKAATDRLLGSVFSRRPVLLRDAELEAELAGVQALYADPAVIAARLTTLTDSYPKLDAKAK
ncbi:MAG: type I-D CRISPR-associated protein Cas7/Csc2 [Chloroflexota bacterium]|nr:type I-D CRISPR-associated protein Cas7/Csc2 [Chloroflexota bacterium]